MSRSSDQRLRDVQEAVTAIRQYLTKGPPEDPLANGLVYDAVRMRLIEIGEAVKSIEPELLESEPDVPWRDIAGLRDRLAHRYFDIDLDIVQVVLAEELTQLQAAVDRMLALPSRTRPA